MTTELHRAVKDPRSHVTPEAFRVANDLLGHQLAAPWRRGLALAADLALVYALSLVGGRAFAALLGLATFWLLVRSAGGPRNMLRRSAVALPAALVVTVLTLALVQNGAHGPTSREWRQFGEAMGSSDEKLQEAAASELIERYLEGQPQGRAIDTVVPQALGGSEPALDGYPLDPNERAGALKALEAFTAAAQAGDPEALDRHRQDAARWLIEPERPQRVAERRQLVRDYAAVTRENHELRSRLENPSVRDLARRVAGSLGLTVGWTGLYFILVPVLWRGRTVGKRLLKLRIVRLNRSPLTPWTSFERFGGYAAGLATGLLGFLQILWDANRQGIHDKIVGTVVLRDP
ncbi:MAG: RDD family protein [Acidobacteriota bacterium]